MAKKDDIKLVEQLRESRDAISAELGKRIIGQHEIIEHILITLFCQGHALIIGVPGLAKTLLIKSVSEILDLKFSRIQFTPDLMPSDITGTEILEEDHATGKREFKFFQGPLFANIILADEINRTPPKTQAALLEAMQEHKVTAAGVSYTLDEPFLVLATQNPIEQEGTYPLPEAQLDRFMFQINVGYPTEDEERKILAMTTSGYQHEIEPVLAQEEILSLQNLVRKVTISEDVVSFILRLVRSTRSTADAPDVIKKWVNWGASPRASQNLVIGSKAVAILDGRNEVAMDDVIEVAHAVLGHRIIPNFAAEAEGVTSEVIVDELLRVVA